jgi:uncharacterized protein YjbJ (UPF0337 family)
MNRDQIKGKWIEIKGEVKKLYGKLTDDDFKQTEGDLEALYGRIMQRYGETKDVVKAKIEAIVNRLMQPVGGVNPAKMQKPGEEKKRDVA